MEVSTKKIAVYGAGAMGTVLGALLTKTGAKVTLITRNQAHVDGLKNQGAKIVCKAVSQEWNISVNAITPSEMTEKYDIIFLMTKQRDNAKTAEFLRKYRPKYFVFENVLGLLSAKDEDGTLHFDNMQKLFHEYGYSTEFQPLNASDYGVFQNRKRIILIGKLGKDEKGFYPEIQKVTVTHKVGELFCDLPSINAGGGQITPVATNHYTGKYLYNSGIMSCDLEPVTFHQARPKTEPTEGEWQANPRSLSQLIYREAPRS